MYCRIAGSIKVAGKDGGIFKVRDDGQHSIELFRLICRIVLYAIDEIFRQLASPLCQLFSRPLDGTFAPGKRRKMNPEDIRHPRIICDLDEDITPEEVAGPLPGILQGLRA